MADGIRLVIHAPTADALERGRRNAANLRKLVPTAEIELVANAGAVAAALAQPDPSDPLLILCGNTLAATGRTAPAGMRVVPAVVLHIAQRQAEGWAYLRA